MTPYTALEDAALKAERERQFAAAAVLWHRAAERAVSFKVKLRCIAAAHEALRNEQRTTLPVVEIDIDAIHHKVPA